MKKNISKRHDSRSEATRVALIEAAESLFAEHGFEAVSMRQIGLAIGSGNNTVVTYHFGTKDAFIQAIYMHRLPAIDARRRELLAEADAEGKGDDLARLLRIFFLPFFEQTDGHGRHSYGRLLCEMLRDGRGPTRELLDDPEPATGLVLHRIRSKLSVGDGHALRIRLHMMAAIILESLRLIDSAGKEEFGKYSDLAIFDEALAMILAILTAPFREVGDRD
ncbi:helix-turn-helix domain-containing protein [Parasphingorhabdus sp.]|uniref:TetR/AcrR family transcriptional regulator n=1 Tax=Parasphingorhabdus sp. TaxID=2709688 RepID=UPI002B26D812|nr:helix-turn-helix domain-containing protein [Parasphingorhabdus sp.]|tara:strand:- start:3056 stop:3718 length:663 start_codon:yes stop_codon:yes gene_type:complete